jgi:hypothetical protein
MAAKNWRAIFASSIAGIARWLNLPMSSDLISIRMVSGILSLSPSALTKASRTHLGSSVILAPMQFMLNRI